MSDVALDPFDARFAQGAPGVLAAFNRAGVLAAADVHVASRLVRVCDVEDELVLLAAAFAVRGPRLGHVLVDLATIREQATSDLEEPPDLDSLPWPDAGAWVAAVAASPLVARDPAPLRLEGTRLYLDRYWCEEQRVADDLRRLMAAPPVDVEVDGADAQMRAVGNALRRRFSVIAGGPGTGKTTTVARLLKLLFERSGDPRPLVALAAPTGKAAARLAEAVNEHAPGLEVSASTLHRLLGRRPGSNSRFRHHRDNRLPHDVVIVDETSMVSLSMMARLVEAVRPDARLVLVGDPGQLASVEAGAVLGDIVGDGSRPEITVLDEEFRFKGTIADLAVAIRAGDPDRVVEILRSGADDVAWVDADAAEDDAALDGVRRPAIAAGRAVIAAAAAGNAGAALDALGSFRLLCAHRRGPHGAATWMGRIESWLATEGGWYAGRPLLVTENDYSLGLFNGDTGVVVADADGLSAAFRRDNEIVRFRPTRLSAIDTVYAMTIHKAQGSQFEAAAVLLPPPTSRVLTRELLYTAVTRAKDRLVVVGTEDAVREAVVRPVARASGLRERLWDA